ncbi:MAG: GAF domain-containing protein [Deltaproteobacteria bacterium]|jgi:PAS domain S-box-containing protein|nr:GAF domain-containing protein [Deltaproteobacteria bacterium]
MGLEKNRAGELQAKLDIYKSTLTEIYERYDQKLEELSLVRRVGDALRAALTVESLAQALMAVVAHEVEVDRVSLLLRDSGTDILYLRAAYFSDKEEFAFYRENAVPWPKTTQNQQTADEITASETEGLKVRSIPRADSTLDPLSSEVNDSRALAVVSLVVHNRSLGLLVLSRPLGREFTPENERMLSIMADQASAALSNVLLFDDLSRTNLKLITSEKRARDTSDYLERLLETANDAILILDSQGRVIYANRKAGQWGWSPSRLLGQQFRLFLEDARELVGWEPLTPPPVDRIIEAGLKAASGERRIVLISTSQAAGSPAVGGQEPESSSWMLMISDVTERRQLERQLLHSEKLASIGLLAAGVAHEIGNPLSAISGYAQILSDGVEDETERKEYLSAVLNQTGRIQKILRELLDYSRPSQGLSEELNLAEHLPRIMGMLGAQRGLSRVKVIFDFDENERYSVTMDRDHFTQVVIIIALNAAQAMDQQTQPPPALTLGLKKESGEVVLKIADNGPGMSPEIKKRVFDPFFTTKAPGQGTGLGLAICQRIVDSYRGRLELTTAPDQGALFTIYFKASQP